ncbi:MAG TPA: glycosyltransferase [Planctomycetota bacterium]|nr:glycosyltransferase [Planctomycetota bacterium]
MRIVHVSHELPPYELAGTAIYTHHIAKAQSETQDVSVFARLQDSHVEPYRVHDEQRERLHVRFFNRADLDWSPLEKSYQDERVARLFAEYLDDRKPDVVHFQHLVGLGLGVIDVARARAKKVVMTLHDFWAMCPMGQRMCYSDFAICDPIEFAKCGPCVYGAGWKDPDPEADARATPESWGGVFKAAYRARYTSTPGLFARKPRALAGAAATTVGAFLGGDAPASAAAAGTHGNPFARRFRDMQEALAKCDLLITPSAFLRDEFISKFGAPASKIVHSSNGMDFSYVEALPKTPSPRLRFGFMGSIIKTKGVHVLVDAFLKAVAGRTDVELHVFGAPNRWSVDYLDDLKRRSAHCPYVVFHGRYDNRKVSQVLQQFDVLVLPSIWFENAPLTLNEAAMSRTPILVSDRGGMLEFVKANEYGWTFRLGDAADLAQKMTRLANDRSLVPKLAGNPPRIKPVRENADELLDVYDRLLSGTWRTPSIPAYYRADTRV